MTKIPVLINCTSCNGEGYNEDEKCDECWGTGLVSDDCEETE